MHRQHSKLPTPTGVPAAAAAAAAPSQAPQGSSKEATPMQATTAQQSRSSPHSPQDGGAATLSSIPPASVSAPPPGAYHEVPGEPSGPTTAPSKMQPRASESTSPPPSAQAGAPGSHPVPPPLLDLIRAQGTTASARTEHHGISTHKTPQHQHAQDYTASARSIPPVSPALFSSQDTDVAFALDQPSAPKLSSSDTGVSDQGLPPTHPTHAEALLVELGAAIGAAARASTSPTRSHRKLQRQQQQQEKQQEREQLRQEREQQ
eukprot:scaffold33548_cov11-Tisochrysis_lutea.AAC.1